MKWLRRIAVALAVLLLLLAIALWWLLGTGSGLRFVLAQAGSATDGALTVAHARGDLAGPLTVEGLRYKTADGLDVHVDRATADVALWSLLAGTARIEQLHASGIAVQLPAPAPPEPEEPGSLSLEPPLDIVLGDIEVTALDVSRADSSLFRADRIALAGAWTGAGVRIDTLEVRSPDGHAGADGHVQLGRGYPGAGRAEFAWTLGDKTVAGTLQTESDGATAHATLSLTQPLRADLRLRLEQGRDYPWKLDLEVPEGDAAPLLGEGSIETVAADLHASGTRAGGRLEGRIELDDWPVEIASLQIALNDDQTRLDIESLVLTSPRVPGRLQAGGQVVLDADPVAAQLDVAWDGIKLPPELAGQALASDGKLAFDGSAAGYTAKGDVRIGPPGKLTELTLDVAGDTRQVAVHTLRLQQDDGHVDATGSVTLQPALAWDLELQGQSFDPGQLLAGWDGNLDFALATHGQDAGGLDAVLAVDKLSGSLRQRTVAAGGRLHLSPEQVLDGELTMQAGESRVAVHAAPGAQNDIRIQLGVVSASDWLPDAAGAVAGEVRLRGALDDLALNADLAGETLRWHDYEIGRLALDADVSSLAAPGGSVALDADDLRLAGFAFEHVDLDARGDEAQHSLTLAAQGKQLDLKLALEGGMQKKTWFGTLTTLDLEPQGIPGWHLADAVPIKAGGGVLDVAELCLTAGDPHLCIRAHQGADGVLVGHYRIEALPLQLLAALLPADAMPIRGAGVVAGSGDIRRSAAGALTGQAELHLDSGNVALATNPTQPLLAWNGLRIHADLAPESSALEVHGELADEGHIDGRVTLGGTEQTLAGGIELHLGSLAFAGLLTDAVANVRGTLDVRVDLAGTLAEPQVAGTARLAGFAAEVPAAGLKLGDGQVEVRSGAGGVFDLNGKVRSGEGELALTGQLALGGEGTTRLVIRGDQFTAADIPAAKVVVSPALAVQYAPTGVEVAGRVDIDQARVDVAKLPTGGAANASPDVVVMDAPPREAEAALPVTATVSIDLGDDTRLQGFGLDGRLAGLLTIEQKPGRPPIGHGQIEVSGTYNAYGQDLKIERGRLLFASTPVANPGLDIRAVRNLDGMATIASGQEVGLQVSGTANQPVLTVFSNPAMSQADALSYLITGKPLSSLKGGEGNLVGSAAQALGSATGDLLAKSIGNKLGIADIGVSSSTALGGAAAFTVGKYLSPRLYLNYGVGLFEPGTVVTLRYLFSRHWNFEAIQSTDYSRAALNYRYEH